MLPRVFYSLLESHNVVDEIKKIYTALTPKLAILNRKINKKQCKVTEIIYDLNDQALLRLPDPQREGYRIWINRKMQIDIRFYMKTFVSEVPAPWYSLDKTTSKFSEHMVYHFLLIDGGKILDSISVPPAQKELYSMAGILFLSCRRFVEDVEAQLKKKQERADKKRSKDSAKLIPNFLKKIV